VWHMEWTRVGPRNHVLNGARSLAPFTGGSNFGGKSKSRKEESFGQRYCVMWRTSKQMRHVSSEESTCVRELRANVFILDSAAICRWQQQQQQQQEQVSGRAYGCHLLRQGNYRCVGRYVGGRLGATMRCRHLALTAH